MSNLFKGTPDARQSDDVNMQTSRFRPTYRPLNDEEKDLHDAVKSLALEMEQLFNQVKDGRYKSLAFTSLEQSVMWITKQITE